jgi:Protein ENHANCED DISEASE RESISTANCE 2, C-terminal
MATPTTTRAASASQQQQQQQQREIRHSGRCHVRGQIRRVWRPRFLELCDNGLVRYYELPSSSSSALSAAAAAAVAACTDDALKIPKCTLQVVQARIIDVTTLRDMHVGLPRGTFGFVISGVRQLLLEPDCKTEQSFLERDFLCAVSTLEEAQSWVVALQWAAAVETWDSDEDLYQQAASMTRLLAKPKPNALQLLSTTPGKPPPTKKPHKPGKIVVTKVQSLRIIRHATGVNLAYQISLLLLRSGSSTEERLIVRTRQDVYELLLDLREESTAQKSRQVLAEAQELLSQAPTNYMEFIASLPGMEGVMRSLAMDAGICNSAALRRFWALDKSIMQRPLLEIHVSNNVVSKQTLGDIGDDTEIFVKEWLNRGKVEAFRWNKAALVWCLQNPFHVGSGLLIPLLVVRPALYVREHAIPTMNLKADVLLISWCLAAYLGREYEKRQPKRPPSSIDEDANSFLEEEQLAPDDDMLVKEEERPSTLSSPLPLYPANGGNSCWSKPNDNIFRVRSATYLSDRVKAPSGPAPFHCRGVDVWITDNPERHIARHPSVLGGAPLRDTFLVNFLLPFGNLVAYFGIPPMEQFPPKLRRVWSKFVQGDQQYRDARLKILPIVVEGPWIVKTAVGPGTAPALLGKVIPLQYYFRNEQGLYEVDVIITASRIAKGILSVVKGHTKSLTIAFAFIIEASEEEDLPETALCSFQIHALHLEDCPLLPECNLDDLPAK